MAKQSSRKGASNVRVAVVGLGMGGGHLRRLVAGRHCEAVAICDTDESRLAHWQRDQNVPQAYTDFDQMLESAPLDAVVIATPNVLHAPMTIKALQAGLHVLCEKPMAMNAQEAERMRDTARRCKRQLLINFNQRFSKEAWGLKRAVEDGKLGDIYAAKCGWIRRYGIPGLGGWFTTKALAGGGPLVDIGVHALDLTLWFMGHPVAKEAIASKYAFFGPELGRRTGKNYDVEDLAMGLVRFTNGATLFLEASWASHIKHGDAFYSELLGTKGGALRRWDGEQNFCTIYRTEHDTFVDHQLGRCLDQPPEPVQHFIDVIRGDAKPIPTAEDGVRVMRVLDMLNASAGKTIDAIRNGRQ